MESYAKIAEILRPLTPFHARDGVLCRIGGSGDGGYVMLDPGYGGTAYSLGVSPESPRDLEMAQRDFTVYQFNGTIEAPPDLHPNLHFSRINIAASGAPAADGKSVEQIIRETGRQNASDLILQMDIEGAEWDVLDSIAPECLRQFKQIIIEYHGLTPANPGIDRCIRILEKMLETHRPVHVHLNNCGCLRQLKNGLLVYSGEYEVS